MGQILFVRSKLSPHRLSVLATLLALALAAVAVAVVLPRESSASDISLKTVDPKILEIIGLQLTTESNVEPAISAMQAAEKAKLSVGETVLETVFAHCKYGDVTSSVAATSPGGGQLGVTSGATALIDQACWVVSLSPNDHPLMGGPISASESDPSAPEATYLIALLDPQNGDLIRGMAGTGP